MDMINTKRNLFNHVWKVVLNDGKIEIPVIVRTVAVSHRRMPREILSPSLPLSVSPSSPPPLSLSLPPISFPEARRYFKQAPFPLVVLSRSLSLRLPFGAHRRRTP